jgi:hypothetical protein
MRFILLHRNKDYGVTAQAFRLKGFRLKAIIYLAKHESNHSRPSRFLRPWVQAEMNPSITAFSLNPFSLST